MTHLAIVKVSAGRVDKYQAYSTEAEAEAHVARVLPKFPTAYVAANPGGLRTLAQVARPGATQPTLRDEVIVSTASPTGVES